MDKKLTILKLYLDNYKKELYVREIAKLLKVNHRTILLNLNKLEKEKILKSKLSGKIKNFFLNLDNISTKYNLLQAENFKISEFIKDNILIKDILTEIEGNIEIKGCLLLFGSFAKEIAMKKSDIDLFLIGEISNELYFKKIENIYRRKINLEKTSKERFERALRKKDPFVIEILKNHLILKNPDIFVGILWRYFNEAI